VVALLPDGIAICHMDIQDRGLEAGSLAGERALTTTAIQTLIMAGVAARG
jgi:hypothetical protein